MFEVPLQVSDYFIKSKLQHDIALYTGVNEFYIIHTQKNCACKKYFKIKTNLKPGEGNIKHL